jgi:hypothetical protein
MAYSWQNLMKEQAVGGRVPPAVADGGADILTLRFDCSDPVRRLFYIIPFVLPVTHLDS